MDLNSSLVDLNSHFWILTRAFKLSTRNLQLVTRVLSYHKIGILKNLAIFTGKYLNLIKKRLQKRYFPVNIAKFLRTSFFCRTPQVAASVFYFFCLIFLVLIIKPPLPSNIHNILQKWCIHCFPLIVYIYFWEHI